MHRLVLIAVSVVGAGLAPACESAPAPPPVATIALASLAFPRIAVVGASMSAGFGGTPFADAITAAAPGAEVVSEASIMMFEDAVVRGTEQVDAVLATKPTLVFAIDYLFWDAYNGTDGDGPTRVAHGLADLARLADAGATVIVGDVPRIVTAPMLIPLDAVPSIDELAAINAQIRTWGTGRRNVLVVPFASWAEPLAAGSVIEITPGEQVPARRLVTADGLHPNALGVWNVLRRVDRAMETTLGTPAEALVFTRPPAPVSGDARAPTP